MTLKLLMLYYFVAMDAMEVNQTVITIDDPLHLMAHQEVVLHLTVTMTAVALTTHSVQDQEAESLQVVAELQVEEEAPTLHRMIIEER